MQKSTPIIARNHDPESNTANALPDWRDMITILIERAWFGIVVALGVFLFLWLSARRETPYFRSTTLLMVEAQMPQMFNFQDMMSSNRRNLEYFNTHIRLLHSRQMMERAIEGGGLADRPGFTPGVAPGSAQAVSALRYVRINPIDRTRIIQITTEHPNPDIAADLANALADAYIQLDLDNRMNASLQALNWLRRSADEYREKLEEGLLGLQQFREDAQSISLEDDQNIVIGKLSSLKNTVIAAQTQLIEMEALWDSIRSRVEAGAPSPEIAPLLEDADVRQAHQQWRDQQRKIADLQQRYLPGHPDYIAAQEVGQNLQRQFEQVTERSLQGMQNRLEMLRERERGLLQALRQQEQRAFELDRKLVRYNDLQRNVQAEEEVYQALINRMKESSLSGSLPTEVIRVVEAAEPARGPFKPNLQRAMSRGAAMGLVAGIGAIFLLHFADRRFRRTEDVERQLNLPVLSTLPLITKGSLADRALVAHRQNQGEVAEAFRTLRARLMMGDELRERKCLMVTSAHAGEGKSLVASNLAISFAQDGQRTLLVGGDLRRPSLHRFFGADDSSGLAEVLKSEQDCHGAVIRSEVPGLDVLTAGKGSRQPSELLGRREMTDFLIAARETYDRIILDAPPILGLSDALILLAQADSVLFVVRYGMTFSLSAKHAVSRIEISGTPCVGCVMNGVNLRSIANYYYYRRYGGYAYYDYRTRANDEKQNS